MSLRNSVVSRLQKEGQNDLEQLKLESLTMIVSVCMIFCRSSP